MAAGERRVHLGYSEAFRFGYNQLVRRLDRSMLNVASIALGLSFYSSLLFTDAFYSAYNVIGGATLSVDATYYWLVAIALTVSIVGITNAMLISVQERVKEIGTMKCLGAMNTHITLLFLVEALLQGVIGGIIGFFGGVVAALLTTGGTTGYDIILYVSLPVIITFLITSLTIAVGLSIMATIYPAYRASRLDPVVALRYEL